MTIIHSSAAANAATNAVAALLGSGAKLKFRTTGTLSSPGTAAATLSFSSTAFGSASYGIATANTITADTGATGNASPVATATLETSGGTVVIHCSVAQVGGDINLSNGLTINPGDTVTCSRLRYSAILDRTTSMQVGMNLGPTTYFTDNLPFADLVWHFTRWRSTVTDAYWPTQVQGQITGASGADTFYATIVNSNVLKSSMTLKIKNPNGNLIGFGNNTGAGASPNLPTSVSSAGTYTSATSFDFNYTLGDALVLHGKGNVTGSVQVLLPGHESSVAAGDPTNIDLVNFQAGLGTKVIRVMDMTFTNGNIDTDWADRPVTGKIGPGNGGIPWEVLIATANRLNCHLWVNIPPRATSAYVTSLMALIASTLNAGLYIILERGNEIWNTAPGFQGSTAWVECNTFTKFLLTTSGTTFTKTAHGFANDTPLRCWVTKQARNLGYDDGDPGVGGDWYPISKGSTMYTWNVTANTFELWSSPGGTGIAHGAVPAGVTEVIACNLNEAGKTLALDTNYGNLCVSDWTIADTALGSARVKATVGGWAANASTATARLAVSGVAARADHVHIAPYHDGFVMHAQLDRASGQFTPKVWANGNLDYPTSTFHYSAYAEGSTPTVAQRKAGTGTGYVAGSHQVIPVTYGTSVYTSGVAATGFTNGTNYDHYIDWVDPDPGFTWTIKKTIAASATTLTTDFEDTFTHQQLRDIWDMDSGHVSSGVMAQIQAHKDLIAASSNPAITVINYEGGSHQDSAGPAGFQTWIETYRESSYYGGTVKHYYNNMAAKGVRLHCHYIDVSSNSFTPTPWRIANQYTDITDARYLAIATFAGLVPALPLTDSGAQTGTNLTSAPSYPAVVKTFADASWTYTIVAGNDEGIYSVAGNVVSLTAAGSINFAVSATQTLTIHATDGFTDAYFTLTYDTGPTNWFEATDRFAWSAVDDTTPAVMNPSKGTAITPGTPATAVTGGWDMSGVANYQGGHGGTNLTYPDSPLFAIVSRVDDDTSSFGVIGQFGSGGDSVTFTTFTGPARIAVDWNGATGAQHVGATQTHGTALAVHWCWIDNANLKVYTGTNLSEDVVGGTSFTSQGSNTFTDFVKLGDARQVVIGGAKCGPAVGDLTAAKALIQKIMTKHGI